MKRPREEEEELPVVLGVQLRRALHEVAARASTPQLSQALLRSCESLVLPAAQQAVDAFKNQVYEQLTDLFGPGVSDVPLQLKQRIHVRFRDQLKDSVVGMLRETLGEAQEELRDMASAAISRMQRRDRIVFGRELQVLGVREAPYEAPLPLATWFNVLSFLAVQEVLAVISRVSRAWFKVSMHDKLWNQITLLQLESGLPPVSEMPFFFRKLKNIITVQFSATNCTDVVLEVLSDSCPNVRNLNVAASHSITDRGIKAISKFSRLEQLDLESCELVTNSGVEFLAQGCRKLVQLSLKYCRSVSDAGIEHLGLRMRSLRILNLNYLPVTDEAMHSIAKGCPHLEELSLKYCRNITDAGLEFLSSGCHALKRLTLSYCQQITDWGLKKLSLGCIQLEELNIKYCRLISDAGIINIAQGCRQLADFNMNYCDKVTDEGIRALAGACHQLTSLKTVFCRQVTDLGVKAMALGFRQLKDLDLESCPLVGDLGLDALSKYCPSLSSLILDGALAVTDLGLEHLASRCKNLSKLNLNSCDKITDSGVILLLNSCLKLKELILTNCPLVTENCLKSVAATGIKQG
jgi:hypothetical protein